MYFKIKRRVNSIDFRNAIEYQFVNSYLDFFELVYGFYFCELKQYVDDASELLCFFSLFLKTGLYLFYILLLFYFFEFGNQYRNRCFQLMRNMLDTVFLKPEHIIGAF